MNKRTLLVISEAAMDDDRRAIINEYSKRSLPLKTSEKILWHGSFLSTEGVALYPENTLILVSDYSAIWKEVSELLKMQGYLADRYLSSKEILDTNVDLFSYVRNLEIPVLPIYKAATPGSEYVFLYSDTSFPIRKTTSLSDYEIENYTFSPIPYSEDKWFPEISFLYFLGENVLYSYRFIKPGMYIRYSPPSGYKKIVCKTDVSDNIRIVSYESTSPTSSEKDSVNKIILDFESMMDLFLETANYLVNSLKLGFGTVKFTCFDDTPIFLSGFSSRSNEEIFQVDKTEYRKKLYEILVKRLDSDYEWIEYEDKS